MSLATLEPCTTDAASERRDLPPSMVERMTLILDAFEGSGTMHLTLEEVAQRTHLPRSTAHRILDQLVKLAWLQHTAFGYSLGQRVFAMTGATSGHGELRAAAAPLLHELQMRTGMVVHLAVLDDAEVSYLDKVGGRFAAAVPSRVGGRAPASCTALGKAMLAWLEPEEVDARLSGTIARRTPRTIGDLSTFHQELHRIRARHGLTFERGECFPDIACAAVAVRGPHGPVGAISVVGDIRAPLEKVAPLVVDAARRTTVALYPDQPSRRRRAARSSAERRGSWSPETLNRLVAVGDRDDWL